MNIKLPELSLVVLIGPSGSGKSTFARKHFKPTEILSSDYFRGLASDDENDQGATTAAFEILHFVLRKRLAAGKLTVIDATNVQPEARQPLVAIAKEYHCLPVAVVFDLNDKICHERNKTRPNRDFGPHVVRNQMNQMRRSLRGLGREGFRHIFVMEDVGEVDTATVTREPLWNNLKHEKGPFDIIGDIHGCCDELEALLGRLGYERTDGVWKHASRKAVFLGDLVDRGPRILDVVNTVRAMVKAGHALCVPGNHETKLLRKLRGKDVRITHGLAATMAEIDALPAETKDAYCKELADWLNDLVSHYLLDGGKLVVAHAGMKETMAGRGSGAVREFALYGETTGETDSYGLPVRYNWAADYRGRATVVYGHTPVPEAEWLNNTVCVDTGCVFGGKLTALRYPEREFVQVAAAKVYCEPVKPLTPPAALRPAQQEHDDLLDISDVSGKRLIETRLHGRVTVREENAAAALEVMSRFAVDPKWLIYLPPTMSPCATADKPGLLEHPAEAFGYYRNEGVAIVMCKAKHMGSRAVVVVCRDATAARKRFGVAEDNIGVCLTRTGRRFFEDVALEQALIARARDAAAKSGLFDELKTDWLLLDCELMPWSAKAQDLLKRQYAAVGTAALANTSQVTHLMAEAAARSPEMAELLAAAKQRETNAARFVDAYRGYCWPVSSLDDLKLAPFHLLASEGKSHAEQNHDWHMQTLANLCAQDALLLATPNIKVSLGDAASEAAGVQWWEDLVSRGGEGMVVKPLDFIVRGKHGLVQPAVKCRGPEYLRIIYGPDYDLPQNLDRLRKRGLAGKRSLAAREFALGVEAIERFVRHEPLRRVHECVFAVLAMESEPVDPRL